MARRLRMTVPRLLYPASPEGRIPNLVITMQNTTTTIVAVLLILCSSGCIRYWEDVNKQQEQNFELADELKWQARDEEMKAKKAQEANTPVPGKPFKPSDF